MEGYWIGIAPERLGKTRVDYLEHIVRHHDLPSITRGNSKFFSFHSYQFTDFSRVLHGRGSFIKHLILRSPMVMVAETATSAENLIL
ncbi:MAG: hypothetical protein RMX65_018970 [Nostoc sp. DedQUE01]